MRIALGIMALVMIGACRSAPEERGGEKGGAEPVKAASRAAEVMRQEIPGAAYAMELRLIGGDETRGIRPFFIGVTEVGWEAYDVFVYGLDEGEGDKSKDGVVSPPSGAIDGGGGAGTPDAVTRPSKPYLPPDRGFGHEGYAAICVSHHAASEFCRWLSVRSGRVFRLASEDEWELACGGAAGDGVDAHAWHAGNSGDKPHRVGTKKANALGVHDMLGNVAEWVNGRDGKPVVKGGSYRDEPGVMTCGYRQPSSRAWNASDPQMPKSKWWLADGPFVGFRVVCELSAERKAE